MKALIVALNPSIDAEWQVGEVLWEEKNNILSERRWAGGKGINVARWLQHLGAKPRILLPLGGPAGKELANYLRRERLATRSIPLREATRVNVIVNSSSSRQLRFNPLGPTLSAGEWRRFLGAFRDELPGAKVVVLSGSLPRGVEPSAYAQLIHLARHQKVRVLLDCDGAALKAAISARPFLVKPNEHELALWWGKPLRSERTIERAAQALSRRSVGWVFVSRGSKRAMLVNANSAVRIFATPTQVKPQNTVGAGDALLAAVTREILLEAAPSQWIERGLEVGTIATQMPAGQLPV